MSEWKEYKLGELMDIIGGGTPKTTNPAYWNGNIPWLSVVDFNNGSKYVYETEKKITEEGLNNSSTKILHKDDIIISARGTVGVVAMIGREMAFNQSCYGIRNKYFVDKHYLYYLLIDSIQRLKQNAHGGVFDTITRETFNLINVVLPSIEEQKRIAGVLSSLDDKIDLLRRENATLEALAETLFRHYFIENPNPDWKEGKLGDFVIETIGGEWGKETPEGEYDMPVRCMRGADVADLNDGLANRTPLRYIKRSKYDKIKPQNGDIILEISGGTDTCSTGRVAYINDDVKRLFDYPIVFSNFCRLLRVEERYSFFLYCFFRYLHKQGEFFNLENGSSGIHNLNYKAALYEMDWSVPTDEQIVVGFNNQVKPYFDKINANKKQILSLTAQRDTLLPELMSGEIKIERIDYGK